MKQTDKLGRATFYHIAPVARVRLTEREIRWLKHIERHGPQSSQYLFELTCDTHRCKDTALRAMQKLRASSYLRLPSQQRATERAECKPYIYDLGPKGLDYLEELGIKETTLRPTGHWWHGYMTSCVTSAIDIAAKRQGVGYIPGHVILEKKNAPLAIPTSSGKLIPDQLFALDYGGRFRAFALEVDRGTEPQTSAAARKSYARSISQYAEVIEQGLYHEHYGLKANLLVLLVFTSNKRHIEFLNLIRPYSERVRQSVLTQSANQSGIMSHFDSECYLRPWQRTGFSSMTIHQEN
ncbi:replication-relaxation family protein [Antarctobacter sp.]|uniref:replication-relaxation family protein n=1 Tax=Antarctobacter sp. TaxID=1872577 RepID=UPI002B26D5DC|nr:replication-relaxation family protein [Antarctobacter sp.]